MCRALKQTSLIYALLASDKTSVMNWLERKVRMAKEGLQRGLAVALYESYLPKAEKGSAAGQYKERYEGCRTRVEISG